MLNLTSRAGSSASITLTISLRTLGIITSLIFLGAACTSSAKLLHLIRMEERVYEISSKLDGFYWSACTRKTIFGNCKKRMEDKVLFTDKARIKQFKDMGHKLMREKDL